MLTYFRQLRFVAALAALTSLAACGKDDPKPAADPVGMSWTVDGANVTAISTEKDVSNTEIELSGVAGTTASATAVILTLPKKVGTYPITATSDASALYIATTGGGTSGTLYGAESGTIVVTNLTATNVTGTFNFTGPGIDDNGAPKPAKTITNGKFNIAL